MKPEIGQVVLYKLSAGDAERIKQMQGNPHFRGQILPLLICRVWPHEYGEADGVNGQIFLDGIGSHWVTSVREGDAEGQFHAQGKNQGD